MDPNGWQQLPDQPPSDPPVPADAPTLVLERTAIADPPPDASPRSESVWWRVGAAIAGVVVVGLIAWFVSDRADARADGAAPALAAAEADDSPAESAPGPVGGAPERPVPDRGDREFFFGPGGLPPELEQFLNENGIDLFGPDGLFDGDRRQFREFFGPDGPFRDNGEFEEFFGPDDPFGEGGAFEEFFGPDGPFGEPRGFEEFSEPGTPRRGGDGFGFSFEGELPPALEELLDMLPGLFFGDADAAEVERLIDELLADPDLPDDIRDFAERLGDRVGAGVEN